MSRRPRVVIEALSVRPGSAGVGGAALEIIGALSARERGIDFIVAAASAGSFAGLADRPDWDVAELPGARAGILRGALAVHRSLPRLCTRVGADLLHTLQFVVPWRCACPVIATVHDVAWRVVPETIEPLRRAYYRVAVPHGFREAAALLASSASTAADLSEQFPAVRSKVAVVPLAVPSWTAEPIPCNQEVRGAQGRPFFLFVGTREPRKNLAGLVDAYGRFVADARREGRAEQAIPDLVVAGASGWLQPEIRIGDDSRGRIRVLGFVSRSELAGLLGSALALVYPSLYEGFGLPILEAMALGTPVLTSRTGAMAEIAGGHAVLVDPRDPRDMARGLQALAWNPDERRQRSAAGREHAGRFSWDTTAEGILEAYGKLLPPRAFR